MERLILRGVMYGAEKIPDSWFDKVPGGFYKAQQVEKQAEQRRAASRGPPRDDSDMKFRSSRTHRSGAGGGGHSHGHSHRDKSRRRRHSDEYEDRRPRYDEDFHAGQRPGYNSDRHRRPDRRSSMDGGDDRDYDKWMEKAEGAGHKARDYLEERRNNDDDRYGYDDGYGRSRGRGYGYEDNYYALPVGGRRPPYSTRPPPPDEYVPAEDAAAAAAVGAGAAAAAFANDPRNARQPQRGSPVGAAPSSGYVPYAHIYGSNTHPPQPPNTRAPPPGSSNGSAQPNAYNQVVPPGCAVHQHAYGRPLPAQPYGSRYADPYDDPYYDDRYDPGYDEPDDYIPPARPPPHSRPIRSPSYDYSAAPPPRRSRSERRPLKPRGKSRSRLSENFDTSQRGFGYGGVGALAGGLIGSEVGKGAMPTALGAAVGGLGANAFGARERFVDPRLPLSQQHDPRTREPRLPPPSATAPQQYLRAPPPMQPPMTTRGHERSG